MSCPAHARRQGCCPRSRRTRSKWPTSCKPARQWPTSGHLAYRKADAAGRVGWAASAAQRSNPAPDHAARADELAAAAERLRTALIENLPATRIIAKYGLPNAVLYVDPPYLETVRTGRHAHAAGTTLTAPPATTSTASSPTRCAPPGPPSCVDETPELPISCDETPRCGVCGGPVARAATGRPHTYCSHCCQAQAYRRRKSSAKAA